jgi:hypothetical protein
VIPEKHADINVDRVDWYDNFVCCSVASATIESILDVTRVQPSLTRRKNIRLPPRWLKPTAKFKAPLARRESACITKMCVYASRITFLSGAACFLYDPPKESKRRKGQ